MKLLKSKSDIVPGVSEERFLRAARQYVETAYPNPDRVGCPGRERLEGLAHRKCPPADHMQDIDHIATCSPCFVEYQAIRKAWKRRRLAFAATGVAAAVGIAVFSGIFLFGERGTPAAKPPTIKPAEIAKEVHRRRVVDLRPYERFRGDGGPQPRQQPGPVILERAILDLTIQLPVGSEAGKYLFELVDSGGSRRLEASGDAIIKGYITTAEVPFDLRGLSPGPFTLTVRRVDEPEPAPYPVEIR
jgi:hypothetical protein